MYPMPTSTMALAAPVAMLPLTDSQLEAASSKAASYLQYAENVPYLQHMANGAKARCGSAEACVTQFGKAVNDPVALGALQPRVAGRLVAADNDHQRGARLLQLAPLIDHSCGPTAATAFVQVLDGYENPSTGTDEYLIETGLKLFQATLEVAPMPAATH